jgi:hypothetical protein
MSVRAVLAAMRAAGDDPPAHGMSVTDGFDRHGNRLSQIAA